MNFQTHAKQYIYILRKVGNFFMVQKIKQHRFTFYSLIATVLVCLGTALLQGNSSFYYAEHKIKTSFFVLCFFLYGLSFLWLKAKKQLNEKTCVFMILLGGLLLRSYYVIFTGVYDRQHDQGVFTGLNNSEINPGHLGYIEYLCKFNKLPDFHPYSVLSYYHPPLYYILAALFLKLNITFGVEEALAFENIQILTMFFSSLCILVSYSILNHLKVQKQSLLLGVSLIAFFPGMILLSGSINNDILAILFLFLCFYRTLLWIEHKNIKNLLLIGLTLALGMITKLNAAVLAFPLAMIFLLYFMEEIKLGHFWKQIRNFSLFGLLTGGIGLSWVIRNLVLFRALPAAISNSSESILYMGNSSLWDIFGIPYDLNIKYPFHTVYGKTCSNSWLILLRTSLFGEMRPGSSGPELSDMMLTLCQILYLIAFVTMFLSFFYILYAQIRKIRTGNPKEKELSIFYITGYLVIILTFLAFVLKYPFTCSADFRYIALVLIYIPISMGQIDHMKKTKGLNYFHSIMKLNYSLILVLSVLIYLFWNQF